ncbi:unnamed protein product, partial [Soboliphyme baturini]|uniref:MARVEL domain-containing protein n=1 Tax=Soboliphyme baturini TaxID=241478 RepID=A0A183ICF7_9BILA
VLSIIIIICVGVSHDVDSGGAAVLYFVSIVSLLGSVMFIVIYVLNLTGTGHCAYIPWFLVELVFALIWGLFFLVSGVVSSVYAEDYGGRKGPCFAASAV